MPSKTLRRKIKAKIAFPIPTSDKQRLELIEKHFPKLEIKKILWEQGLCNRVAMINDLFVFRFPMHVSRLKAYYRLFEEPLFSDFFRDKFGNLVQKIAIVGDDKYVPFLVNNFIEGKMPDLDFLSKNNECLERFSKQLAIFFRECHLLTCDDVLDFFIKNKRTKRDLQNACFCRRFTRRKNYGMVRCDFLNVIVDEKYNIVGVIDLEAFQYKKISSEIKALRDVPIIYDKAMKYY